jgi:NAD(P)-dependent dehydrogenase (short-subunit alcohol dehydrogenase family)
MAAAAAPAKSSLPDFKGKTVVVLGGTGNVGSGVVWKNLEAGARVIVVGREQKKLDALKTSLGKLATKDNLATVVGDFNDEKAAAAALAAVHKTAPEYHHVVSNIGFAKVFQTGVTQSKLSDLKTGFEESLYPTILAAQAFLPPLKDVKGSSYTISSGGLAHFCMMPGLWCATMKNAALNALGLGLAKEYEKNEVRVNVCCIHFGVAAFDGDKNQFGMASADCRRLAPLFLTLASSNKRGLVQCANTAEEAEKLAESLK